MGIFGQSQAGQARYSGELHNLQLTQSVFGTTAPIIFGTRRVAAKLLFYGGFYAVTAPNSGGGKGLGGGKGDTAYDYYADVQLALASGSASGGCLGLLNVWDQQGKLQNESGSYTYTVPPGGGTVTPMSAAGSPPIQQDLGVSKAATYSVVANDYGSGGSRTLTGTQSVPLTKVTGTPAAGQYSFNASTSSYTFAAADAGAVVTICYSAVFSLYYFEQTQAAEIPLSGPYQVSTNVQQYFWSDGGVVRVDTGAPLNQGSDYTESSGVYTFASNLAGVYVYITYTYTSSDSSVTNTSTLNLTFFGGTLGQTPASYMQSKYPGSDFGYTGICYLLANPMALGESAVLPSYNYEVVGLNIFPGGGLDAHPCDAFRTLLYDAFLGVGFPSANVDAWTSAYAYWAANGYLLSSSLDTQTSVSEALSNIIETGNVGAVWSGGLLKLIPYGDATCVGNGYTYTPNTTPVAVFTWNNLLSPSETKAGSSTSDDVLQVAQKAPQDCLNYVQAQWCNRANDYNNELINEQNDAFVNDYGRRIESPQTWDWITTAAAATWALNLRLKRQCYIRNTYKFWLPFWFSYIEPMDIVTLPTGENVRITQIEDDPDGRLSVEAEQWTYGSGNVTIYPKQAPSSFQPNLSSSAPGDAVPVVIQNTITQNSVPYLVQIARRRHIHADRNGGSALCAWPADYEPPVKSRPRSDRYARRGHLAFERRGVGFGHSVPGRQTGDVVRHRGPGRRIERVDRIRERCADRGWTLQPHLPAARRLRHGRAGPHHRRLLRLPRAAVSVRDLSVEHSTHGPPVLPEVAELQSGGKDDSRAIDVPGASLRLRLQRWPKGRHLLPVDGCCQHFRQWHGDEPEQCLQRDLHQLRHARRRRGQHQRRGRVRV
jgi:hypothetical protein